MTNILKEEIKRKLFHLLFISIPVLYYFVSQTIMFCILSAFFLMSIGFEILRFKTKFIGDNPLFNWIKSLLRKHEWERPVGATYAAVAGLSLLFIVPKPIFMMAFSILAISDALASLIGIRFGTTKSTGKSIQGSVGFCISACLIVLFIALVYDGNNIFIIISLVSAIISTIAEFYAKSMRVDDNLLIPFSFCLSFLLLNMVFPCWSSL